MSAIRPAVAADAAALDAVTRVAYAVYLPRMDREPGPMRADHAASIAAGRVHVLDEDGTVRGLIVLDDRPPDALHVASVAVRPDAHGLGFGRALLAYAEAEALRRGFARIELYTNAAMTENLGFYPRLGYEETGRRVEDGYARVYFVKRLEPRA